MGILASVVRTPDTRMNFHICIGWCVCLLFSIQLSLYIGKNPPKHRIMYIKQCLENWKMYRVVYIRYGEWLKWKRQTHKFDCGAKILAPPLAEMGEKKGSETVKTKQFRWQKHRYTGETGSLRCSTDESDEIRLSMQSHSEFCQISAEKLWDLGQEASVSVLSKMSISSKL